MDWLDEITKKHKLKTSFFIYNLVYIFIGIAMIIFVFSMLTTILGGIQSAVFVEKNPNELYMLLQNSRITVLINKILKNYRSIAFSIATVVSSLLGFRRFYKDKIDDVILDLYELTGEVYKEENYNELDILYDKLSDFIGDLNDNKISLIKEKDAFDKRITDFGHDIKNPLAIVKGNVEMMELIDKNDNESFESLIISTNKNIKRIENYINRLDSLRKLETIEVNNRNVLLEEFVEVLIMDYSALESRKKLVWNYPKDKITCYFDDILISEVMHNLIDNAIRFAKENIEINFKVENKMLYVEVLDDGKGFSNEALVNGKTQFFTENPNKENLGLGLNISNNILGYYGGDLNLENTKNGGKVSFEIKLENN
ncbi:MAG: HAMP domain-containing sensor histidine kinase [Miniphocaeibacter sp.]|uniref:sensor histidine kinase n=1 Tax=Miniphocaeibacter sp. TaxID=3100973 RepID=UPI00180CF841|nr:HAMP domain-containing histidine kinase [Gallicola sp.]